MGIFTDLCSTITFANDEEDCASWTRSWKCYEGTKMDRGIHADTGRASEG